MPGLFTLPRRFYSWLCKVFEEEKGGGKKNSIAVLDGVRAIAILLVIFYHVGHSTIDVWAYDRSNPLATSILTAGSSGVTLFFVLSGLLLFMPYARSLLSERRWPLARVFYMRRALRILPGYYFSLIILILLTSRQYLHPGYFKETLQFFTLFMDSTTLTWRQINGPYWSLAVEWQFYLLMPLLMLIFAWIVKRFPLKYRMPVTICCLLATIAWALIVRSWGFYYAYHHAQTFLVPRGVLNVVLFFSFGVAGKYTEDFAVGMLVSLCYIYAQQVGPEHAFSQGARRLSLWAWGFGILALVFASMWHYHKDYSGWPFLNDPYSLYEKFSELVFSIGYGSCVFAVLFGPALLQRPFAWPWLRWIGLMSYSLYIWHLPLILLFTQKIAPRFTQGLSWERYALSWLWVLLVVFPFCLLTYLWVEKPWIKRSDRWRVQLEQTAQAQLQSLAGEREKVLTDSRAG